MWNEKFVSPTQYTPQIDIIMIICLPTGLPMAFNGSHQTIHLYPHRSLALYNKLRIYMYLPLQGSHQTIHLYPHRSLALYNKLRIYMYLPLQGSFLTRNSSSATHPPPTLTITVLRNILTSRSFWESPNCKGQVKKFRELWSPARQQIWPWSRSKVTVKVTTWYLRKGLVPRNTHAKYQSSICKSAKVMAKVKVFVTDGQTDRQRDEWDLMSPRFRESGGQKCQHINILTRRSFWESTNFKGQGQTCQHINILASRSFWESPNCKGHGQMSDVVTILKLLHLHVYMYCSTSC